MKKILFYITLLVVAVVFIECSKDESSLFDHQLGFHQKACGSFRLTSMNESKTLALIIDVNRNELELNNTIKEFNLNDTRFTVQLLEYEEPANDFSCTSLSMTPVFTNWYFQEGSISLQIVKDSIYVSNNQFNYSLNASIKEIRFHDGDEDETFNFIEFDQVLLVELVD